MVIADKIYQDNIIVLQSLGFMYGKQQGGFKIFLASALSSFRITMTAKFVEPFVFWLSSAFILSLLCKKTTSPSLLLMELTR